MERERYVVIMAGGKGERFWPQSRLKRPKHLLPIVGDKPMLTQTVERLGAIVPPENVIIITNAEQADAVKDVCPMLPAENVIAEPVGRDTAAAVGLATILVKHRHPDAAFAMLPADHVIADERGFQDVVRQAFIAAETTDALVTVGIQPTYPSTGYGYIERGIPLDEIEGRPVYDVAQFKEKPDEATAQGYVESKKFFWNAGMFFWRVETIAGCLREFTPGLWKSLQGIEQGLVAGQDLDALLADQYPQLEKISIDFAVMEKAKQVRVIEANFDWDDVGSWPAVERHYPRDASGNVTRGEAIIQNGTGNIVVAEKGHLVSLIGVDDLIVVQTGDATLICSKDKAQDIKQLVKALGEAPNKAHLL